MNESRNVLFERDIMEITENEVQKNRKVIICPDFIIVAAVMKNSGRIVLEHRWAARLDTVNVTSENKLETEEEDTGKILCLRKIPLYTFNGLMIMKSRARL